MDILTAPANIRIRELCNIVICGHASLENLNAVKNALLAHLKNGTYTRGRAMFLMDGVAESAAKMYVLYNGINAHWCQAFPDAVRNECARRLVRFFEIANDIA